MSALYHAKLSEFLLQDPTLVVGHLSGLAKYAHTEIKAEQLQAWHEQITILHEALDRHSARSWHLLFEYPIPRRGKRIDVIILAGDVILVIEFKCGSKRFDREGRLQVEDYCLDLRDFHSESRNRILVPILVATHAQEVPHEPEPAVDFVASTCFANSENLARAIERAAGYYGSQASAIDPLPWNDAEYIPTPTIVEAARVLYEGKNVREISRCHAGAENLSRTSNAVIQAVQSARELGRKLICFVTGVPGSGKTLAGLNIVHNRGLHDAGSLGVFLSGNGPLVKVLSEALARDHATRCSVSIGESRRRVSTFIQNVHRFIDAHFASSAPPPDRVVVFDEAQRAWNREQSQRKFKRNRSEPEIMLEIMDRHEGWAVIVALVGGGQEINTGEAGIAEWGHALSERFPHWNVLASPHVITALDGLDSLFDSPPTGMYLSDDPCLHLEVALRSYKAQAVSEFVTKLLERDVEGSHSNLLSCPDFPIQLTRDLQTARDWLQRHQRGTRRVGLIASSGGRRLRAHGLDVRAELDVENWFLNPMWDVRSSCYLETPATEFGVQGLELDWTGVCWDIDLVPNADEWQVQAFKGTEWQSVRDPLRRRYVLNKYRVLLTRAREGTVIWIPRGDPRDRTRPTDKYNMIETYLKSCGIQEI